MQKMYCYQILVMENKYIFSKFIDIVAIMYSAFQVIKQKGDLFRSRLFEYHIITVLIYIPKQFGRKYINGTLCFYVFSI